MPDNTGCAMKETMYKASVECLNKDGLVDYANDRDYISAKMEIEAMQTLSFGHKINVLLITDRLYGCAQGLQEYLKNSADITVDLVDTFDNAKLIIKQKPIDFLIVVGGMFDRGINYAAIHEVRKLNKYASVIMYAIIDWTIESECRCQRIEHMFSRYAPMEDFVSFMRDCYNEESQRLNKDFSSATERGLLWIAALQSSEQEKKVPLKKQRLGFFNKMLCWLEA